MIIMDPRRMLFATDVGGLAAQFVWHPVGHVVVGNRRFKGLHYVG